MPRRASWTAMPTAADHLCRLRRLGGFATHPVSRTTASRRWSRPMTWEEAVAFALSLPDTELSTSYGKPAVKVASNGRAFLYPSHEADTSFGVAIDLDTIEILKETDPDTFWQSPHYVGWEGVLIRYDSKDEERVREVIARSREFVQAKPRPRKR